MAILNIQPHVLRGLRKIAALTNSEFEAVKIALQEVPIEIKHDTIFDNYAISAGEIPPADVPDIVGTIFAIHMSSVANAVVEPESFIRDIIETYVFKKKDVPIVSEDTEAESHEVLKDRITVSLNIQSLRLISKAYNLLIRHSHVFDEARILSDFRPVFKDDIGVKPSAAVIIHNLQITYSEAGTKKEFFIALDCQDIDQLLKQLERAKAKSDALRVALQDAGIQYIDVV